MALSAHYGISQVTSVTGFIIAMVAVVLLATVITRAVRSIPRVVFQPPLRQSHYGTSVINLSTSRGNRIPAFFFDRTAPLTILVSHGNAEDLNLIHNHFHDVSRRLNVNVMAYEYSGYGKSTGTASERDCYADIDAAFKYLVEVKKIGPQRIVLYGRSIGSGPTCYLAERLSKDGVALGGVILQSPVTSVYRVAIPFRWTVCGDMFPNIDRMANIDCPVFVIHGTRDEIVPFEHGQELFLSCKPQYRARPYWVEGGGHNNLEALLIQDGTYHSSIREFLNEWCTDKSDYFNLAQSRLP